MYWNEVLAAKYRHDINSLEIRIQCAINRVRMNHLGEASTSTGARASQHQHEIEAANKDIDRARKRKKEAVLRSLLDKVQKARADVEGRHLLPPPYGDAVPLMRQRKA